jgi:co-chaperonin GroES (HSP10)
MKVRPLRDWVCIRPMAYTHEFLYVTGITLRKGEVIAIGPGRRVRRRIGYRNNPDRVDEVTYFDDGLETGAIRPMRVKVGDFVEFGWRAGREFTVGREKLIMVPEQSCYGLTDGRADQGLLEPQSMAVPI